MIFRGSGPELLRNPFFVIFQVVGVSSPSVPPLDPRMVGKQNCFLN